MGFALAEELAKSGAEVTLVCGPNSLSIKNNSVNRIDVTSADEMLQQCVNNSKHADVIVMAAAVADFKPKVKVKEKIKKEEESFNKIELIPTKDILSELGKNISAKRAMAHGAKNGSLLVGFALETENEIQNAKKKLHNKNIDLIVLNSPSDKTGFNHDTNKITIISPSPTLPKGKRAKDRKENEIKKFELMSKSECAKVIVHEIINHIR